MIVDILVITDGVVAMPDSNIMETLLFQLHYDSIAVSFIKVGSTFHPHSSAGYISYTDLLNFFSHSSMGVCLESSPDIVSIGIWIGNSANIFRCVLCFT